MILTGFTIEATTPENRRYYLVNGWYKHFALWIRKKDADSAPALNIPKIKFNKIPQPAVGSLARPGGLRPPVCYLNNQTSDHGRLSLGATVFTYKGL